MEYKIINSQHGFYLSKEDHYSVLWNQGGIDIYNKVYSYEELNCAFNSLVNTYQSFRMCFKNGKLGRNLYMKKPCFESYSYMFFENEEDLLKASKNLTNAPLRLNEALYRCIIFNTPIRSGYIFCIHHMIVDGFSTQIMGDYLNNFLKDNTYTPQNVQSYNEYIQFEEEYINSKRYQKDRRFWSEQFLLNSQCSIFDDKKNSFDYASDEVDFSVPSDFFGKIKAFCDDNNISVQSFFNTVYSTCFFRTTYKDLFALGVPVLNRTTEAELNTIGLYMHIVPLIVKLSDESFLENALGIEDAQMNLFRHQKFTQYDIKELLKEEGKPLNNLFDVATDYQEFEENKDYEFKFIYSNSLSLPLEIHMQSFGKTKHNLKIRYKTSMFTEKEIQTMINSIIAIAEDALEHPDKKISELNMLSSDEQKLLTTFNNTSSPYDKHKCIHELFEEQVERTPDKTALVAVDRTLTYRELNEEANRIAHSLIEKGIGRGDIVGLMLPRKSCLLAALFGILKTGAAYLPIDPEHPAERIEYMLSDSGAKYCITEENICGLKGNADKTNPVNESNSNDICYCIFTSGSTGQPKGTLITHRNVANYTSANGNNVFYGITGKNCESILSVTTVGFDIFVTESILPLVNGLEIILADEEQSSLQNKLAELVIKQPADVLQTTPTKMKAFMTDKGNLDYLKKLSVIILGGEALDTVLVKELKAVTDAEIYNIYGPTEATVWVSYARIDDAEDITIGKPIANTQVHILDKHLKPVPVGVTGELCIAGDSVSAGYLNRPEQTAERFIDNPFGEGKLYRTGDNAYWREDGNIVYVGRSDFQVKIRGLRIELGEIESAIQAVEGIERAVVVVRKDSEGRQLICAFCTGEEKSAGELRDRLSAKLPRYMVPHIFTYLSEMPLTASGKVNRNALPEIDLDNISTETEYKAPETEREILLAECVSMVLGAERVSVLDNFFDIGGDSLKAIELTAKLEEKGYTVSVKTIFSCKDIAELAEKLEEKQEEYVKAEYGSELPATAAQMRVYTAQMMKPDSLMYNITYAFKAKSVNKEKLEKAVNTLIERHESLRSRFENREGQIVQIIEEKAEISVEYAEDINSFAKPFDLGKAPLVRVGCNENTVIVSLHHITVDGESMPVFFRELNELYMGRELEKTVQYGEFAVTDGYTEENERYWLEVFREEVPQLELPKDGARKAEQSFNGSVHYEQINRSLHERIEEKCRARGVTPYVYYTACFSMLLSKLSGNEDVVIGTPVSGRQSRYLDTVGMFVNTIALRCRPEGEKTVTELLGEIRDSSVEAIDNQSYPFGELVKKLKVNTAGRNPLFDVMLAYQSFEMTDISFGDEKAELIPLEGRVSKCDISLHILPRKDDVVLATEYCTDLYGEERIADFVQMYTRLLEMCLDDSKLIRDISVTDTEVINSFNNTKAPYAKDKCIHELFEEQVERTPDRTALVAVDRTLTYRELNEEANRIAHALADKGVGGGDIVGLMLPRKSCFLSALFGILKIGAAYLPIDPDFPADRVGYIISYSNAKLCVSEDNISSLLENRSCENLKLKSSCEDICYCIYTSGSTGQPKGTFIYQRNLIWYMFVLKSIYGTENINMPFFTSQSVDLTVPSFLLPLLTGGATYLYNGELKDDLVDIFNNDELTVMKFTPTHMNIICNVVPDKLRPNIRCIIVGGETLYKESCFEFLNKFGNHIEIHNEYGPTEATVSCTDYIFNPADKENGLYLPIGKPVVNAQVYITDKYMNPVPIGVTGEICIAGDGVGAGYLNNPELTAEKFIDNPFGEGKLYRTGDNAYWREDGNIIFVGRKDSQIKLNGRRIELGEIENAVLSTDGVVQCAVVVRKDSEGRQLICAFCTGEEKSAGELRDRLSAKLPRYMVPHIFTYLSEMPLTASGKVNRNALPEIDLDNISTETEYKAPETDEEKALAAAVCSVMNISGINMLDNFFDIGGDSIRAIYIVSELADMGYELRVADIMKSDTLSDAVKTVKATHDRGMYDQGEVNGFIPFSPIMRAFLSKSSSIPADYVHTCVFRAECDEYTARKAIDEIVSHHDILRGVFCDNGIQIMPSSAREVYSFEAVAFGDADEAKEYINKVKISTDKLVNIVFCTTEKENLISMTVHHFLIDLVSWEILIKDFQTAVGQIKNNEQIVLPAKTASFMLWSEELQKYSETISEKSKEYWESINDRLDNTKSVNFNVHEEKEAEEYSFTLDRDVSYKLINEANTAYGTRTNELLLTALGLAAAELAGGSVGIIVESHGRAELKKHIAVESTVGWFTACYPVIIDNNNAVEALISTKENLRRISEGGIDYLLLNEGFHKNIDIKFNFYKGSTEKEALREKVIAFNGGASVFPETISVNCFAAENILTVNISVPEYKHAEKISERLGAEFIRQIIKIVDVCTESGTVIKTRSDFSDDELTEAELEELKDLFDWTDVNEQ